MAGKYDGHSVPCDDGSWHWIGPWKSGVELLTGQNNAVIFDPDQEFGRIQISEADRALIADAPKLLRERDDAWRALLNEYEMEQIDCLSDQSDPIISSCEECGGCRLTEKAAELKKRLAGGA